MHIFSRVCSQTLLMLLSFLMWFKNVAVHHVCAKPVLSTLSAPWIWGYIILLLFSILFLHNAKVLVISACITEHSLNRLLVIYNCVQVPCRSAKSNVDVSLANFQMQHPFCNLHTSALNKIDTSHSERLYVLVDYITSHTQANLLGYTVAAQWQASCPTL